MEGCCKGRLQGKWMEGLLAVSYPFDKFNGMCADLQTEDLYPVS